MKLVYSLLIFLAVSAISADIVWKLIESSDLIAADFQPVEEDMDDPLEEEEDPCEKERKEQKEKEPVWMLPHALVYQLISDESSAEPFHRPDFFDHHFQARLFCPPELV